MRALVQVVTSASVSVEDEVIGAIDEPGLVVLVGVTHDDTTQHATRLADEGLGIARHGRRAVGE